MTDARLQPDDSRRIVARASLIMFVAITLGRVLGFGRDALISHFYGQGNTTDLFNVAFILPDLLYFLLAGGALTAAFIPVFTDYLTRGEDADAWQVFSSLATVFTVVVAVVVVAGEIWAVPLARLLLANPKYTPADVAQCAFLMRIILPAQVCFLLGGLMMGSLQSRQHFLAPAAGPLIYNAAIIAGGVLLKPVLGIAGFSWGAVVGAVAGNVALQALVMRRVGVVYRPAFNLRHPGVRRVGGMMAAVTLSLALPQILMALTRWFAADPAHAGLVTALSNANRLMQAPLAMFGQSLAVALLPTLSALAARNDVQEFRATLSHSMRAILFATVPVSALMMALSFPIIRMVFQHGAFTAADTAVTAPILAVYCTAVAAWSVQAVVARACFALGDNRTPVVAGLAVTGLFVVLNVALLRPFGGQRAGGVHVHLGDGARPGDDRSAAAPAEGDGGAAVARSLGMVLVASVPAAGAAWGAAWGVDAGLSALGRHLPAALVGLAQCAAGSALGLAVFAGMAVLLRIPEARGAWSRLRRRRA